ncbi:SLC35C2 [Mytilus coruscus]|uniref:SLC35C2 n=1 Tax=Mytilus coruscus TaxID=42192 RepID=A0A6J8CMZ9_MYTCO|nr:SLC35C2 [Mytilus coruscus]
MGKKRRPPMRVLEDVVEPRAKIVKTSVCSCSFVKLAIKTLCLVIFYYTFSIGLTFYNQRFIHHFKIPLSLTMAHLVIKFILAGLCRCLLQVCTSKERVTLPWDINVKRIAPTGIASILDIALSNWSFEFITVSLYTMTKSTAVVFILGFSLCFRLEKPRWSLIFVVLFIAGGLFMFTFQSTQFDLEGFLMVFAASILSGLRWTLAQIVTQKHEIGLSNPLDLMFHIQPWMIVGLLPLSIAFEGELLSAKADFFRYSDVSLVLRNAGLVILGAVLAFFLEFSEFLLLANTSSLTLSIAGIFKEICTLYLAATVNGDKMTFLNGLGLVACLAGITLHVILKAVYRSKDTKELSHDLEMLIRNGEANVDSDDEIDVFNARTDR